ncbi:MAG: hypothetical protein A2086_17335 [Spirochaetes bacterium GWD1_27_9]|nr:MAG: hypothetical protein A2Z98_16720 [Spirochaetes bacterium GWB1_27_13]OHD42985.1 MAG: hypothetical protein A2086_17335 [Spirochaetes bacterium GWD1_27_9]
MSQILKDNVRNKIIDSALVEFSKKGFIETSMLNVANTAGVSVGNIYRYFKNKEELFYTIIRNDFAKNLKKRVIERINFANIIGFNNVKNNTDFQRLDVDFVKFCFENKYKLIILFDKAKGTTFENFKEELILDIKNHLVSTIIINKEFEGSQDIFTIIYANLIQGMIEIVKKEENLQNISKQIDSIIKYHLFGFLIFFNKS